MRWSLLLLAACQYHANAQLLDLRIEMARSPEGPWGEMLRIQPSEAFFRLGLAVRTNGVRVIQVSDGGDLCALRAAALPGTVAVVSPGRYQANNLLKPGLDWYFADGAEVTFREPNSGAGCGIFDDRGCGPTTNWIGGYGRFRYLVGIPPYTNASAFSLDPTNFSVIGAVVITHPETTLNLSADRIEVGYAGTFPIMAALCLMDGTVNVRCHEILGGGRTRITDEDGEREIELTGQGIFWGLGEARVTAEVVTGGSGNGYAVWCEQPDGSRANNNFWLTADLIDSRALVSTVYVVGLSNEYRTWIVAKEIKRFHPSERGGYSAYAAYSGGRHYVTAQKISNVGGDATIALNGQNVSVWLTAQKISGATNSWIRIFPSGGRLFADVHHFDDEGGIARGIWVDGGELHLRPGYGKVLDGDGLVSTNARVWADGLWLFDRNHPEPQ